MTRKVNMTRAKGEAILPGHKAKSRRKHRSKGVKKTMWRDEVVDAQMGEEYNTTSRVNSSRYWQPSVDERDDFGHVTVYDGDGKVIRVIDKKELTRPWQASEGTRWNTRIRL